jgi:hypothetical protein
MLLRDPHPAVRRVVSGFTFGITAFATAPLLVVGSYRSESLIVLAGPASSVAGTFVFAARLTKSR